MKILAGIVVAVATVSGGALAVGASQHSPVIPQGTVIGVVPVGGLSPEEGRKRLRLWWEGERTAQIKLTSKKVDVGSGGRVDELGLYLDDEASIKQVQLDGFWEDTKRKVGIDQSKSKFPIIFGVREEKIKALSAKIDSQKREMSPARVTLVGGKINRTYENAGIALDAESYRAALQDAFLNKIPEIEVPLKEGAKKVPDEELEKIIETASTFTTHFPASNRPRCANIKRASEIIDGLVLMPGEQFAFNTVVGKRTVARGFKEAGVYVNGRHDTGVGGGICQVSTTLYNALLMGDFKIVKRSNHSLPVAYVPVGRDATVSFPNPDLVFENNKDYPIALDCTYSPGTLTFNILGIKEKGLKVEIIRGKQTTWSRGTEYKHDPSLPFGKVVLIDRGGAAHKINTWRYVYKDGKLVRKEDLGTSYYPGSPRLYGKNMRAKAPAARPSATSAPAPTPEPTAPSAPDPNQ